ncbi:MAG: hypothetical protein AAGH15_26295 [Myxococcota bacterium]
MTEPTPRPSAIDDLNELMKLEQDRISRESLAAAKRAEAEEASERAEREARFAAEEAELRTSQAARAAKEQARAAEDAANREKRESLAAQIRQEKDLEARSEEQVRLADHQERLSLIEKNAPKKVHPAVMPLLLLLAAGIGAAIFFGVVQPQIEAKQQQAELAREQAIEQERVAEEARLAAERDARQAQVANQDRERIEAQAQAQARAAAEAAANESAGRMSSRMSGMSSRMRSGPSADVDPIGGLGF